MLATLAGDGLEPLDVPCKIVRAYSICVEMLVMPSRLASQSAAPRLGSFRLRRVPVSVDACAHMVELFKGLADDD